MLSLAFYFDESLFFLSFDESLYPFLLVFFILTRVYIPSSSFFLLTRMYIPFSYLFIFWRGFVSLPLIFLSFDSSCFFSFFRTPFSYLLKRKNKKIIRGFGIPSSNLLKRKNKKIIRGFVIPFSSLLKRKEKKRRERDNKRVCYPFLIVFRRYTIPSSYLLRGFVSLPRIL